MPITGGKKQLLSLYASLCCNGGMTTGISQADNILCGVGYPGSGCGAAVAGECRELRSALCCEARGAWPPTYLATETTDRRARGRVAFAQAYKTVVDERSSATPERSALIHECSALTHERLSLTHERSALIHEHLALIPECLSLTHERSSATHECLDVSS